MRVLLTIDRVVLDGLDLSPRERARLLEDLQESLRVQVMAKASGGNPVARSAARERADLTGAMGTRGARLGEALGKTVVERVWTADRQSKVVR
jgi:hypothetical protein